MADTEKTAAPLPDDLADPDPLTRSHVASAMRGMADNLPGRPTVGTPATHSGCWPTGSIRLMGADPFLRGACGTPGMARTFGTCEGDTRDRMVRTSSGVGAGIAASSRLRAATILRWWCETAPHRVDREFHL